jgi:hypothetical protein
MRAMAHRLVIVDVPPRLGCAREEQVGGGVVPTVEGQWL